MIKVLKFKETKEHKVWFVSDLHWNHNPKWPIPLWKARGYTSLEESNKDIINKINEFVGSDDTLWSLGDLTLNCGEEQFESFIDSINCKNIFSLWGNHPNPMLKVYKREIDNILGNFEDRQGFPIPVENEAFEIYPFRYKNLIFCGNYAEIIVNGQYICLNHYPLSIWNFMKADSWALVGHSHHGYPNTCPDYKHGKILDCGWDGFKKPLSFSDIKDIMSTKEKIKVDLHH